MPNYSDEIQINHNMTFIYKDVSYPEILKMVENLTVPSTKVTVPVV
jgi:hypothetical protein